MVDKVISVRQVISDTVFHAVLTSFLICSYTDNKKTVLQMQDGQYWNLYGKKLNSLFVCPYNPNIRVLAFAIRSYWTYSVINFANLYFADIIGENIIWPGSSSAISKYQCSIAVILSIDTSFHNKMAEVLLQFCWPF